MYSAVYVWPRCMSTHATLGEIQLKNHYPQLPARKPLILKAFFCIYSGNKIDNPLILKGKSVGF